MKRGSRWLLALCWLGAAGMASAAVYQCEINGHAVFSDRPCSDDAERLEFGPFTEPMHAPLPEKVSPPVPYAPPKPDITEPATEEACPYINSTKLRRHIVAKEVVQGMSPTDVERAWGRPSSKINRSDGVEWLYRQNQNNWKKVYFRDDCVVDWEIHERVVPYPYRWGPWNAPHYYRIQP
ncbi:MAG TPA: DUF4124 domain-containing protein [Alcanivoracaceae bacterium]|nr:DUF4124 domain-containing protein [Alcanivoracaceae bacterium]